MPTLRPRTRAASRASKAKAKSGSAQKPRAAIKKRATTKKSTAKVKRARSSSSESSLKSMTKEQLCKHVDVKSAHDFLSKLDKDSLCSLLTKQGVQKLVSQPASEASADAVHAKYEQISRQSAAHLVKTKKAYDALLKRVMASNAWTRRRCRPSYIDMSAMRHKSDFANVVNVCYNPDTRPTRQQLSQ